ncbi:ATP-grasp domain-containing protein [Pontivivens insulae]|uniref:ATP-grasp domain-containing protein n=1 Tax=Pontivivens insulae TaxID=1639689 RepID=A0A2R8A7I0_9RHOB|nr:ATP-grasp domain-containing protein [Pontivivens insulae]RED18289.1 carbamoyl-phosphate synthase large subunit [Pontivivens insulae]SPF28187.1 hypothetical protein POI8812_00485 [Pontivivens insulae]
MNCIVITAIGGDIAQGVARTLRRAYPSCKLVGTDMGTRHAGHLFVDEVITAPEASESSYRAWLDDLLREKQADFCIPMSEAELVALLKDGLEMPSGVPLVTAGQDALRIGQDKLATVHFLEDIGVPSPWCLTDPSELTAAHLPCIYKPRSGSGSKALFICSDVEEVAFHSTRHPGGIFQELLLPDDQEYTCAVFRDRLGQIAVLQLHRELADGATAWAEVVDIPQINEVCTKVSMALNLRGALNIQLRLTEAGPRIFEINARFSSTAEMRALMGFKDVIWTLEDLQGKIPDIEFPPIGSTGLRTSGVVVQAEPFCNDGST